MFNFCVKQIQRKYTFPRTFRITLSFMVRRNICLTITIHFYCTHFVLLLLSCSELRANYGYDTSFFYFLPFRFFIVASFPFPSIIAYRRDPSDALARRLWCPNEVSSLTTSTVRLPSLFPSFRCVYRICTLFTSKVRKMRSFLHRVHRGFFFRNWIALTSAWPFYLSSTARYTFYILATRQKVEKMNKGKAGRRRNRSALV